LSLRLVGIVVAEELSLPPYFFLFLQLFLKDILGNVSDDCSNDYGENNLDYERHSRQVLALFLLRTIETFFEFDRGI
jgi:hypothetical protein